jgi:hypothetical protein
LFSSFFSNAKINEPKISNVNTIVNSTISNNNNTTFSSRFNTNMNHPQNNNNNSIGNITNTEDINSSHSSRIDENMNHSQNNNTNKGIAFMNSSIDNVDLVVDQTLHRSLGGVLVHAVCPAPAQHHVLGQVWIGREGALWRGE